MMNIKEIIYKVLRNIIAFFLPISQSKVLFIGYYGSQYGCNPKYLSQAIAKVGNAKIVWAFCDVISHVDCMEGRKVKYGSIRFFINLYTSRVIVSNYRMPTWFNKRNGQIYIQTWHSSLRLKKVEGDALETLTDKYIEMAKHDSDQTDMILSGCRFSSETFKRAFWFDGEVIEMGTPRCDSIIFPQSTRHELCRKLHLDPNLKYVLYAPTFRDDHSVDCYDIDFNRLCGEQWRVMIRLHPHLKSLSKCFCERFGDKVIDMTAHDDLQELMIVSDMLISDYSGLIFDYALTRKPCLLYTADLEEYMRKERDLYFDIKELPFPIALNNEELKEKFENFDLDSYHSKLNKFNEKIGNFEDGHASENIARHIYQNCLTNCRIN